MTTLVDFIKNNPVPDSGPHMETGESLGRHIIDGINYHILTKLDGTTIKTDQTNYDKWADIKYKLLNQEFPNLPFCMDTRDEELIKLDLPFTEEPVIFIRDNRASKHSYMWDGVPEDIRNKYNSNIRIQQIDNKPITLRQIINQMAITDEYSKMEESMDDHRFLEGFDQSTPIQYSVSFGS